MFNPSRLHAPGGLKLRRRPGADGAARLLLHRAVAALLNASHPELQIPDELVTEIIRHTYEALSSGNRAGMLRVKDRFDLF